MRTTTGTRTGAERWGPRAVVALVVALASVTVLTAIQPPQPSGRQRLRIVGGVGYRQFMRVGLWLADSLAARPDAPEIWFGHHFTGRGFRDSVLRLASGQAELALVNARGVAAMAVRGRGMFERPVTNLRAIAALPHLDWTLFAVDAGLGVRSFADIAAKRVPLKLATGHLDGDNAVGFVAAELVPPPRHRLRRAETLGRPASARRSERDPR